MGIVPAEDTEPTLFAQQTIITDTQKARRVRESIPKKISHEAQTLVETVFLSCLANKEIALLRFLWLGYRKGARVLAMLGHPDVQRVLDAEKHLRSETHLLTGFVRFSDYGGVLGATITPKNFVLPFLAPHFVARYPHEEFLIFDKNHRAALVYQNRRQTIVPLEDIQFPQADEMELAYRALWKHFYNTVSIKARENPRCRMTHMPKRYWENMTEMAELLEEPAAQQTTLPAGEKRIALPQRQP